MLTYNSALGVGQSEELKSMLERCRVAMEEASGLWATTTMVCGLALGTSFSRLEHVVKDGAFFGAHTTLSMVTLHYDSIDLQAFGKGFRNGRSDEELDTLERVAALAADALDQLVSTEAVLQGREVEQ
jgi:hypothetical protein